MKDCILVNFYRHPRAGGDPARPAFAMIGNWIPACAGMTTAVY